MARTIIDTINFAKRDSQFSRTPDWIPCICGANWAPIKLRMSNMLILAIRSSWGTRLSICTRIKITPTPKVMSFVTRCAYVYKLAIALSVKISNNEPIIWFSKNENVSTILDCHRGCLIINYNCFIEVTSSHIQIVAYRIISLPTINNRSRRAHSTSTGYMSAVVYVCAGPSGDIKKAIHWTSSNKRD